MAKSIHELEQEHFHHKLATFAIIFFLVFLSFIILVVALQPKDERAQSLETKASESNVLVPQTTQGPTPQPSTCFVGLANIAYKLSNNCKGVTGAQFTCTNGYTGEINGVTCRQQSEVKEFANQQCLFRSTCNTEIPTVSSFMMLTDATCKKNQSKVILVKCDEGRGNVSWASINRAGCQTQDEWQKLVRTSDVCVARRTPWISPPTPTPTYYPKPSTPPSTPTPPYKYTPTPTAYITPTNPPHACGYSPCKIDSDCFSGLICVTPNNNGQKYCALPQYQQACAQNPSVTTCCTEPTPTPNSLP